MADEASEQQVGGEAPTANVRIPPYISFQTLLTFIKDLKTNGLPPQIDKSVMSKLAGGMQGQLKMGLRSMALIDGDKPLHRVSVGAAQKVIYIATQSVANAMALGEACGVGFPRDCVFDFEQDLFDSLVLAWQQGDHEELAALWRRATPLKIDAKVDA